jgi:hypothetical protein
MIYWCNCTLNTDNIEASVNFDIEQWCVPGDVTVPEDSGILHKISREASHGGPHITSLFQKRSVR